MAEEIVSCPGCGKKFRIPDGAPPGAFDCTACGASVAYGGKAGKPRAAKAGGASKGGRPTRRPARRAAAKPAGGRRRRRRDEEPEEEEGRRGRRRPKEKNTGVLIVGIMGCVLLAGILGVAFFGGDDPKPEGDGVAVQPDDGDGGIDSADLGGADGSDAPDAGTGGTAATDPAGASGGVSAGDTSTAPTTTPPDDDSGIGETTGGDELQDYRYWFLRDKDELFAEVPPLEGTTEAEAEEFRRQVALFVDIDSGGPGMSAGRALEKAGPKAMPFLMSAFGDQWRGSKWTVENEQWACWQLQQKCRQIILNTKMPSNLEARFNPGGENDPKLFQRAARMWVAWWRGTGQHLAEFEPFPEDEM